MKTFSSFFSVWMLMLVFFGCTVTSAEETGKDNTIEPSTINHNAVFSRPEEINDRELIIKFQSNTSESKIQQIITECNGTFIKNQKLGNYTLISIPQKTNFQTISKKLAKYKEVVFVEPNYKVEANYIPSDPFYSKQWYLKNISLPKAWDVTKGSSAVVVAVIDGGVQVNHPELKDKITKPFNILTGKSTVPADDHGTHVAGIIAATMNKMGVTGIAPNVKIMPINVFDGYNSTSYDISEAIIYAANAGADIINLSLGSEYYSSVMNHAVQYAASKGVLLIAAAGNSDTYIPQYPAALDHVLGITATDKTNRITSFSNYGDYIDFSAPGEAIYSTKSGNSYTYMSGTSMAAPVVSGVSALILSKNPFLTPEQVTNILKKSSVDLGYPGWDVFYGFGKVNAYNALAKTPAPLSSLTVDEVFRVVGTNKLPISFTALKGTFVSLYVENSKGTVVKKLLTKKSWSGGKVKYYWDGKSENGSYVSSGTYKIVARISNKKKSVRKFKSVILYNKVTPEISLSKTSFKVSPNTSPTVSILIKLNKSAKVSATVFDKNGKIVRKLWKDIYLHAGENTLRWDYLNQDGNKVIDGNYKLVLQVMDSRNVRGTTKNVSVLVDSTPPKASLKAEDFIYKLDGSSVTKAKVFVNEKSKVTVFIYTSQGEFVKTLLSGKTFSPGTYEITWDGTTENESIANEGSYQFIALFEDELGNTNRTSSDVFLLEDWRPLHLTQKEGEAVHLLNTEIASFALNKTAKVTVNIYKESTLIQTIIENEVFDSGSYLLHWDGTKTDGSLVENGVYTFTIKAVDSRNSIVEATGECRVAF